MDLDDVPDNPKTLNDAYSALRQMSSIQREVDSRYSLAQADKLVMHQLQKESDCNPSNTTLRNNVQEWREDIEDRLAESHREQKALRSRRMDMVQRINNLDQ